MPRSPYRRRAGVISRKLGKHYFLEIRGLNDLPDFSALGLAQGSPGLADRGIVALQLSLLERRLDRLAVGPGGSQQASTSLEISGFYRHATETNESLQRCNDVIELPGQAETLPKPASSLVDTALLERDFGEI